MPSTIRQVALEAGLSPTAVSRYLNGRIDLPAETRQRIDNAVVKLNYRPSAVARRLRTSSSETLGFVTTDIGYPFFAAIASAAEAEAEEQGYTLAIFNSRNRLDREIAFLAKIADQQLDGILFLTNHTNCAPLSKAINALGRVVLLDEDVPGATAPRLFADNVTGGRLAVEHLLAAGHRDIAFVGGERGLVSVEERLQGFAAALAAAGIAPRPEAILCGRYDENHGAAAFGRLCTLSPRPTAVVAAADMLALGLLRAARKAGVEVPSHLSIVSFEDSNMVDLLNPALTTVRQSPEVFGRQGIRMIVDLIRGGAVPHAPLRVPVELVARGSVAAPPYPA